MTKIAFIGIDGSGKTSLINALFESDPYQYLVLCQPHDLRIKKLINATECPLAHAYLFAADRAIQLEKLPIYPKNKIIVFDRWHDCTVAYQGYGMGVKLETLQQMGHHLPHLDYVFWLDCDTDTAIHRAITNSDRYSHLNRETLDRIRQGYEAIYRNQRHNPKTKYVRLDSQRFSTMELLAPVKTYLP